MPKKTGILSLGTRKDATTWENGCKGLGFDAPLPIKKPSPSMDELKAFFSSDSDWLFIAGHFGGDMLFNEKDSVSATFSADSVELKVGGEKATVKKGTAEFQLDKNCKVVLWGGCSVCSATDLIRDLQKLFGAHVLLGFKGSTGWKMVDAMLGGGFIKTGHFFERVKGHDDEPAKIRDAWMQTALKGYGGDDFEDRFRAIDPDGQEWEISKKKIKRGRKIT